MQRPGSTQGVGPKAVSHRGGDLQVPLRVVRRIDLGFALIGSLRVISSGFHRGEEPAIYDLGKGSDGPQD
jgi:hypothetical protein